jgi:predicted MFS family arabinose efflux permease
LVTSNQSYLLDVSVAFLVGSGLGLVFPSNASQISLTVGNAGQGLAAGWSSAAQGLGYAMGPAIGVALYKTNHLAPFALAGALFATIACLTFFVSASNPSPDA